MSLGDIIMVFENTYASYVNLQIPGWIHKYPAARFAHVIYATSGAQFVNAISLSRKRQAGYVYVTDGTGLQRYNRLPSYWSREDAIFAKCADADIFGSPAERAQIALSAGTALAGQGRREQCPIYAMGNIE